MSESIVRKIQPFTIGTKLSVPSVPKCPDFAESYLPSQTLDNCKMQHNLNDQVSLYLGQSQMHPSASQFSPVAARVMQVERRPEEMVEEDHLNRNAVSPTSASRSIKKITISGSTEAPGDRGATVAHCSKVAPVSKTENINNNNNNIAFKPLPRIVGVSCENKPNSQFKVFLRKEADLDTGSKERSNGGSSGLQSLKEKTPSICQNAEPRAVLPRKESLKMEIQSYGHVETPSSERVHTQRSECSLTQLNAQFNREILQAEAWIKGKLRDLKDGCSVQRCPLQDWEEVAQTLQRDLKDFENTLIQLNQMGEQLICRQNPTADQVKKQLSQLKDQWQLLRQTAGNHSKALSGARNLQEFNRKVDKLEVWIKAKQEEDQSLAKVLGQNIDKLQLTRKILDLKQDEQLYRTLHEEINSLALKLEKLGKNESKNISARRKHINKMWLKVQTLLKDFHEKLQLALELSSFYQQADNVIRAINNKRKSISSSSDQENSTDREIRDIASHIMMLDVTASQLSNLHPALATGVTQKQGEVKDGWALLQKAVRNEKAGLQSSCLVFTREDGDPLTPTRGPQCSVGTEVHRIMGKEVKEEQNRLKGCVSIREPEGVRTLISSQVEDHSSKSPTTETGINPCHSHDVSGRSQADEDSKKHKTESHTAFSRGNSQLQVQLQKFTVSADKTLSWLKDNVAMATHLCCAVGPDGFEEARRCQAALEEDILSNRARIEVVQKEGRSLVRAQHPGSAKIEEFLGQLDVLWEELKKRHQKNAVVLQESEKLDLKAQKVLKDLSSLEAWLQTVESSIRQSSLEGDPESVSAAERESSLLEREVASRGLELRVLRQEVDKLSGRRHVHTQQLARRMDEVEEKYRSVQEALKQQTSELQDTRMLTEFLERVELEECLEPKRMSSVDCNEQARGSELRSNSSLLQLSDPASQLIDSIADPVEELREAVEMLNDTVRERGRSLIRNQDQGIKELLSQHSALTVRINGKLSRSLELHVDIHEMETEMAVKCEPDQCGLEDLEDQQEDLEIDYEIIKEEVDEMEKLAAQLEELCPEKMQVLGEEVRSTLHVWEELGKSLTENRARLRQFLQLQDFFRNYLAMISWTEDTRACIFSDTTVHPGKGNQMPVIAELDKKIEQKFAEFDDLAAAGQKLIDEEHHLTEMIKERTEELRSMLGWILVRWRAQKHQRSCGKRKEEPKGDVIYSEATICSPQQHQSLSPQSELPLMAKAHFKGGQRQADFEACSGPDGSSIHGDAVSEQQPEACYEVMAQIGQKKKGVSSPVGAPQGLLSADSPESPFLVLKEPSAPSLGGTVNLILSFGKKGDSQLQVQDPVEEGETQEPVHRPSESQSSACKNFWKRCQGLLENTFGSLKRKKKIYQQSAEEDQSVSLLSVHMGLEGHGNQLTSMSPECDRAEQGHISTTGGLCSSVNGKNPEFQSMAGTLERKHKLQLGGKKAACRAWNTYHAVLFKQTLCFYQDRKDTLKSTVAGLPLNLTGAECAPAPEYTKKANCFSLRLRDGSEYLLSASSRFLMKKWILKIQANTGLREINSSQSVFGHCVQDFSATNSGSTCHCSPTCHCPKGGDTTSYFSGLGQPATTRSKEIIVLTRDNPQPPRQHHGNSEDLLPALSSDTDHCEDHRSSQHQLGKDKLSWAGRESSPKSGDSPHSDHLDYLSNKRRSYSFTSATYQKITPVSLPSRALEGGSSYSVTLFIGDQQAELQSSPALPGLNSMESVNHKESQPISWNPETIQRERNFASLPRPRNKSVFKKFFGKKE
ncbi:spectrin beta chain, non-erythrocytic 5 isoform X5 [Lepisosteus oculatus]|uniref:spectrin beta chain, non-erythrocytic 5 isoform X5 n=1 Tax=Lepisosteus oculatus TaxID=7918 RepID=UPI0035F500F5